MAEAFAAVRGNDNELAFRVEVGPVAAADFVAFETIADVENGIDAGVAGDGDLAVVDSFGAQVGGGPRGGGEVQRGEAADHHAIHFLGKRLAHIAGSQAGLDMAYGNSGVECRECAAKGGCGVALHQDQIGAVVLQYRLEGREHETGGGGERLTRAHDVEVVFRFNGENLEHL